MTEHLDMRTIERLVVGDLDDVTSAQAHVGACERCGRLASETRAFIDADLRMHPSLPFIDAVQTRAQRRPFDAFLQHLRAWTVPVAAAACGAFAVLYWQSQDTLTHKGSAVAVFRYRAEKEHLLQSGDALRCGDRIEVRLPSGGHFRVRFVPDDEAPVLLAADASGGSVWFEMAPPCTPGVIAVEPTNATPMQLRVRCED